MRTLLAATLLLGCTLATRSAHAQDATPATTASDFTPVSCPSRLNQYFNDYQPVYHEGQYFWSEWTSISATYPLPSPNWYQATPNPDVVSGDGSTRWISARILVECYAERILHGVIFHYHPIQTLGRTQLIPCTPDDGGISAPLSGSHDPHAPAPAAGEPTTADCAGGGGGGGGEGGGTPKWVCLDVWIPGQGWVEVWCGYAYVR